MSGNFSGGRVPSSSTPSSIADISASASSMSSSTSAADTASNLKHLQSLLAVLSDPHAKDEVKLKSAQELSDSLDSAVSLPGPVYQQFLQSAMTCFVKILQDGRPHFIVEYNVQQVRKLVLEMIQRLPANEMLKPYAGNILSLTFKLLEVENEENVLVCLRIIIELHKQFRPPHSVEITQFLQFVKSIYKELPNHLNKIFEPRTPIKIKDLNDRDFNLETVLGETFTMTTITTEKKGQENQNCTYNLIPKATLSLKVKKELLQN